MELITPVLYASSQLHRIPLPPLIMVPGAGALAADETAVQSNDSATLRDGGKERNWLAIIGVATGVVSAVTGVIALVLTNFAEQSDPSPPPFISATPAPMPSPTPTDAYQENGGDNGDPAGMEAGGGERGADGGGGTGGSQGSQTSYSIGNPPPVGGCPDGAERDEDGICPEDFGVFPLEEAIDQRDPSDERVPYEPRFFPSPVPVPPPAPPPAPPPPSPIPQCQFGPYIVFFDPDEATLTPVAAQILRQAIDAYASCGGRDLTLAGHTDTAGSLSENIELAGDRAKRVQDFLIAYGVPAGRISTEAFGESMPRIPTADGVREGQNNRVVLTAAPGVSPPADQVRAAEEYRTARFSVNSRIDTINRLRAEIDRSNSTVLGWPVVTRALDNSERDTLVEAARELLARDAPAPVSEIYRAAAEPLTDIADELLPYAQDLNRLLRAIASYNQSRQILDRDTAGLSRFLEADLRRLAPLLDDDAQGRMADTERSNRRVMGEAANGSMAAINDIEEATQRLINARNDTRDALSQYRRASNMRAKRLRRDFRLIDRAVTAARDVSLEITSPYQRAEDEVLARCLGEQMKLSLAETAIEFAQYPTNSDWFRFQRGGRLNCDDTETETVSSIAARSQAELEEMREDGPLPVLAERIIVETKKRRFTAPESGIVPLGAHRELRLRLDGAESLAFDERSVRLEPQAIRTINRIANWLDDYNQSLWSLPPIACEPGEECGDASTKPMALVIEAAINPSKSPELSKKAAGVRLDSILRQLRQSARFDLEVTAIICKSPWHESENGTDVVNLSLVPGGMEIMLDQCAPIQDVTFNLDGQNEE
ncbi:MAG: OmpA family protein [Pseudomonadota bacterium]